VHVNISLQFDITSAFIARANKKKAQQATKGKAPPSSASGGTVTQNAPEYTVEQNMDPQSHSVSSSSRMNGVAPVTNGHSKTPTANTAPKANISEVCTADCVHVHCTHTHHTHHTHTHTHTHTHHTHTHTHICTQTQTHMHAHTHARTHHTRTHTHTHTHACTHMTHTHTNTYAHTHMHAHTHARTHTCTHAHTHTDTCNEHTHTRTHNQLIRLT